MNDFADQGHDARPAGPRAARAAGLSVDAAAVEAEHAPGQGPRAVGTPPGVRGHADLRSPGVKQTPLHAGAAPHGVPDFITQTDRHGRATTPRSAPAGAPAGHVARPDAGAGALDAYDSFLDSFRSLCCCLGAGEDGAAERTPAARGREDAGHVAYSTRGPDAPLLLEEDSALRHGDAPPRIKLLSGLHPDDRGKKCLVLDLDETLVHSSFREVPGADFVIPVRIDDVVHHVYVAKRPGVDEFLVEMAKHYEIVVYTASLNKYADPLLDLLDPHRVIRTRLFRESCVFYAGNFVKDMSLINRDLRQAIIIDNSPTSYLFHPENAIDCSSFIDDPHDRELDQIGNFLIGIRDVEDVRGVANAWRQWPHLDLANAKPYAMSDR